MENNPNGYIAIYSGKQIEVWANSLYSAQELALKEFQKTSRKKIKGWDISVILCELNSKQVIHNGSIL